MKTYPVTRPLCRAPTHPGVLMGEILREHLRLPVAEIPTIWLDRQFGESNFKLSQWIPKYLKWYRFAFGSKLTVEQVRSKSSH